MSGKAKAENVQNIPITDIHPFEDHPFKVLDDELMQSTVESVSKFGVLNPVIVRPDENGGYEMISGHRRLRACELAGVKEIPAIVRDLTRDEAIILMVDSNLQRETILPCERAAAYKMKMDALKRQGQRTDLTSGQLDPKLNHRRSNQIVADDAGESVKQVQRYIRLTELIPELQDKVNSKEIAFTPAVELSFLRPEEQKTLLDAMEYAQTTPSLSQAQKLKKLSQMHQCKAATMYSVMSEEKKSDIDRITFKCNDLQKYFPKSYTPRRMEETILRLLEQWQKKREQQQER